MSERDVRKGRRGKDGEEGTRKRWRGKEGEGRMERK
jgi:hypothetical protein